MTPKEGRGGRIMKFMRLQWALQTAAFAILFSAASRADDGGKAAFSKPELQAKLEYCKTCHGLSGQGYRGYYPMPRLAGQQTDYLESQLRYFVEGRRLSPLMFNVARVLNPPMRSKLATQFRELNPRPIGGAPRELMTIGKKSTRRGFQIPALLHALLVMVQRLKARRPFLVWQVSS